MPVVMTYPGADGAAKMEAITRRLRENPPFVIAGMAVTSVIDYFPGIGMPVISGRGDTNPQTLPSADVLEFQLEKDNKLLVRPSGTELKIKTHLFAKGNAANEAEALLRELDKAARELLS